MIPGMYKPKIFDWDLEALFKNRSLRGDVEIFDMKFRRAASNEVLRSKERESEVGFLGAQRE